MPEVESTTTIWTCIACEARIEVGSSNIPEEGSTISIPNPFGEDGEEIKWICGVCIQPINTSIGCTVATHHKLFKGI